MTEAPKGLGSPDESGAGKKEKRFDLGFWLVTIAWGTGAFVYGWLFAGIRYDREYWKLTFEALGWADWSLAGLFGCVVGGLSFWASSAKESVKKESKQLFRIVVAVLPALFLVSALAVLVLTLATYNEDWVEARQGIATAFAALIAAVGVVVSVAVSYKTGEENRILQKQTEQQKLDAELIKSLNDRLHEIIARRYGDKSREVSASYFQLAALYRDWETLADNSELVKSQKGSQQRNILKLLFGVYQESDGKNTSDEKISSERSEVDIRTLNSVIQDIFPTYKENSDESVNVQESVLASFDLSYLDLRGLDISMRDLRDANLVGAHLEGADLSDTYMEGAELDGANLVGTNLVLANLTGVTLRKALLKDALLWGASLRGADLSGANLAGSDLLGSDLDKALMKDARFTHDEETLDSPVVQERIIDQLKLLGSMLEPEQLRSVNGFDKDFRKRIMLEWINYDREMRLKERMDDFEIE